MINSLILAAALFGSAEAAAPQCQPDKPSAPVVAGLSLQAGNDCCDDQVIEVDYAGVLGYYYAVCFDVTCGPTTWRGCGPDQSPTASTQVTFTQDIASVYGGQFCDCSVTATLYEGIRIEGEIIWRELPDTAITFVCEDPCL